MIAFLAACTGPQAVPPDLADPQAAPDPVPMAIEQPAPEPAAPEPAEPEPEEPVDESDGLSAGSACNDSEECASGVCEGEGCDEASPGICTETTRACTADRRPFCGCDDLTFFSSSTCPGARYAHEGPCSEEDVEMPEGEP